MKIKQLNFAAFGPFTDRQLHFDQHENGLHIIYGPNEAGKSSALRALKALLYGIQERTVDTFLHAANELRIQGCLQNEEGHELAIVRRKGRKNTLLDSDGKALDEKVLTPFLHGIKRPLFEALFGIDHEALQQGGQEILQQKGEVGETLFSASLGSHTLHAVLAELDGEAELLFKPRGSNQKINAALKSFSSLKKQIREISLSSREWDSQRQQLDDLSAELLAMNAELKARRSEVSRLTRIKNALPGLARYDELVHAGEALGDVVILPDDFASRHAEAVKALDAARLIQDKTAPRLAGLKQDAAQLGINQDLLDQAETIQDLHARLGGYRKAMQDRPHLKSQAEQLLTEADFLLKEVRPDLNLKEIEQLRPLLSRYRTITELGNKKALLISRVEQVVASQSEAAKKLEAAREEENKLAHNPLNPASSAALNQAINVVRKLGDLDGLLASTQTELERLQRHCDTGVARLPLWQGALQEIPLLAVPNRESINHFEKFYLELERRTRQLEDKQVEINEALEVTRRGLDEIRRAGDVPTEEELVKVRSMRNQLWKLLRRQWVNGDEVSMQSLEMLDGETLPDTFERRLFETDELADRLRREAERVHSLAGLQAKEKTLNSKTVGISQALDKVMLEKNQLDEQWRAVWADCRVAPRTPREMRSWLDEQEKLANQVEQLNDYIQKQKDLQGLRMTHIELLNEQLGVAGRAASSSVLLEPVLIACEELYAQIDQAQQRQVALNQSVERLDDEFKNLSVEQRKAQQALGAWFTEWRMLMNGFGLAENSSPAEVSEVIDKLRKLFDTLKEAEKLQIRVKAIDEDGASFQAQVSSMMDGLLPAEKHLPVDDAVLRLNALLSENLSNKKQRQQINLQIAKAEDEIKESGRIIEIMRGRLDALVSEAACTKYSELDAAQKKSDDCRRVKQQINSTEQELIQLGEGVSIADLRVAAQGIDRDELSARIQELNNKIEDELEPGRNNLTESKGRKEKELELMDGSDRAALLADRAQMVLAALRADAERYVRLKLSSKVLRDEIERYRRQNQGPLVKSASDRFALLTGGSFESLRADFNEKDEPVLMGIRPGGEQVSVEGMSSGTRDQLYLALRLASLEKYMQDSEPMPFIVDDILVDFDDERSAAALRALSQLATKTQVILFTHHSRVVEQAGRLDGEVNIQELN